jgi:hypothetical protein
MFKVTCLVDQWWKVGTPRKLGPVSPQKLVLAQRCLSQSKHKQSINKMQQTCPGLGLGNCYVSSSCLCPPVVIMVILILLVWRIGFGVTGMELVGAMPTVQGFVRCDAGSLWLVIIPKSKDRFMERPPMKTVQPWAYIGTAWHSMW